MGVTRAAAIFLALGRWGYQVFKLGLEFHTHTLSIYILALQGTSEFLTKTLKSDESASSLIVLAAKVTLDRAWQAEPNMMQVKTRVMDSADPELSAAASGRRAHQDPLRGGS